jgi:hypothetical protein
MPRTIVNIEDALTPGTFYQVPGNTVDGVFNPIVQIAFGNDDVTDVSEENPLPVTLVKRTKIEELSFNTTLSVFGVFQTDWIDIRGYKWLDFDVQMQTNSAISALLEFSDDPNNIVRSLQQTIAGTGLGSPSNILSFGVPAQMTFVRIRATDLTGGQLVKVVTYGQDIPPPGAQLPLASTITPDFRAPLVQAVERAFDPANKFQARRFSGKVDSQSTTTTLLANQTFLGSTFIDTTGFIGIVMAIKANSNTIENGIKVLFTMNNGSTIVLEGGPYTYDVAPTGRFYKFPVPIPGAKFKVSVTAGNSDMTGLELYTFLIADDVEDSSIPLGDNVNENVVADVVKAQLVAEKDGNGFQNIGATISGNLKAAITEHTIDTPIRELRGSGLITSKLIDTGPAVQADDPTLSNRKTISIFADDSNTDAVYYGYTNTVDPSTGFKLPAGQSKEWEIGDNIHLYFCTLTDGQKIYIDQIS